MIRLKLIGIVDIPLIIFLLLTGVYAVKHTLSFSKASELIVYRDNSKIAKYPLATDTTFVVNGKIGKLSITIRDSLAYVSHATCPHQECMRTGKIGKANNQIVCAPNHVVIAVQSDKETKKFDAVAQ